MDTNESRLTTRGEREATNNGMRFAQIGTASALAFSMLALVTSIYQTGLMQSQTELMQKQSRASVWPYLSLGENSTNKRGEEAFTWRIDNNGVGPARIESVVVSVDGKPYTTWAKVYHALSPDLPFHGAQSSANGVVLPPSLNRETTIEMFKPSDPALARATIDGRGPPVESPGISTRLWSWPSTVEARPSSTIESAGSENAPDKPCGSMKPTAADERVASERATGSGPE
jgi:hypothetical protein